MARTIPKTPIAIPSDANFAAGTPITSGSAGLRGRPWDLVQLANLSYSTVCADCLWAQSWADGQATQGATAGAWVTQTGIRILPISSQHLTVTCSIYASSPSGTGNVAFTAVAAGTSVLLPLGVGAAWVSGTLDVTGGFGAGYETIQMAWQDDVTVESVRLVYEPVDSLAAWPGADGALPATQLEPGVWALDTAETAADLPYSAALLHRIRAVAEHVQSRPRPVACAAVPIAADPAITWASVCAWPHRVVYLSDAARTIQAHAYGDDPAGLGRAYLHAMLGPLSGRAILTDAAAAGYGVTSVQSSPARIGSTAAPDGLPLAAGGAWASAEWGPHANTSLRQWVEPPYAVCARLEWMGAGDTGGALTNPVTGSVAYAAVFWEV